MVEVVDVASPISNTDINGTKPVGKIRILVNWLANSISAAKEFFSPYYERFRQLSNSGTGIGKTAVSFFILVISSLIVHTNVILSPFSNLDYSFCIFSSVLIVFCGHYFAARLSQDGRWKFLVFLLPIILAISLLIYSITPINPQSSSSFLYLIIGYLVIFEISLLGGILSGEIKGAPWLGSTLYLKHIQSYFQKEGINYLFWNSEGKIHVVDSVRVIPRWDERKKKVIVRLDGNNYPFNYFTPVYVEGSTYGRISSAMTRVDELFANLPPAWEAAISKYKKSLTESVLRTSWLIIIQFIIPDKASSLLVQGTRYPGHSQRIETEEGPFDIIWPPPSTDWKESNYDLFKAPIDSPLLNSALMLSPGTSLQSLEAQISITPKDANSSPNLSIILLRNYLPLMVSLYENISTEVGRRSEICKQSIRKISFWYSSTNENIFQSIISEKTPHSSELKASDSNTVDYWNSAINDSLAEPQTKFLTLHDNLLHIIEESKYSKSINGAIERVILKCTEDIISSGKSKPGAPNSRSENILLGRGRDLGIDRKANLLVAICKMELIYKLLDEHQEDES